MAEYRSYASPGQFAGGIKVPDKATANRQRDKEFIQELKDQNRIMSEQDATLLSALRRKYEKEASARNLVEKTRREGISAERRQREKNAKLEADFAEMEAKQQGKVWEQLSELVPQLGQDYQKFAEKRKNFNAEQARNAIEKSGLTDEEWREFRSSRISAEEFATGTQGWLVKLRDEGGITWQQYNAMMQRTGGYGLGFERADVHRMAESFNSFLISQGDVEDENGNTLNKALTSTELSNNGDRPGIIESAIDKFKRESGYNEYNYAFLQETLKGKLDTQWNRLRNIGYETGLKQSQIEGIRKDRDALRAELKSGSWADALGTIQDPLNRHAKLRADIGHIAHMIGTGELNEEDIEQVRTVVVSRRDGKRGTIDEMFPALSNALDEAVSKRQATLNSRRRIELNAQTLEDKQTVADITEHAMSLPADQRTAYYQSILRDPDMPNAVKADIYQFVRTDESIKNHMIGQKLAELQNQGIPVTQQHYELWKPTGSMASTVLSAIQQDNPSAEYDKTMKGTIANWVRKATGRADQFDNGHSQAVELQRVMLADYRARRNALIPTLGVDGAHKRAYEELQESFNEGIDEQNPRGLYKFLPDRNNPLEGKFTNIAGASKDVGPLDSVKISRLHDAHGDNLDRIPNTIWENNEMSTWVHSRAVSQKDWARATAVAEATTQRDTHTMVMLNQWEASMDAPPPEWLVKAVKSQKEAISLGVDRGIFHEASKPGASFSALRTSAIASVGAIPGITRILGPWQLGFQDLPDGSHSSASNAHFDVEFTSRELAAFVGRYLLDRGINAREHPDLPGGVQGVHARYAKSHYNGFKIDIGFAGSGSTGEIGTEADKAFAVRVINLMREATNVYYGGSYI